MGLYMERLCRGYIVGLWKGYVGLNTSYVGLYKGHVSLNKP